MLLFWTTSASFLLPVDVNKMLVHRKIADGRESSVKMKGEEVVIL
jgi:hypothetical protein